MDIVKEFYEAERVYTTLPAVLQNPSSEKRGRRGSRLWPMMSSSSPTARICPGVANTTMSACLCLTPHRTDTLSARSRRIPQLDRADPSLGLQD